MGLQDELREAVQAKDTPRVQDILDRIATQYRNRWRARLLEAVEKSAFQPVK